MKHIVNAFFCSLIIFAIFSCNERKNQITSETLYKNINKSGEKNILLTSLPFDSLIIANIPSSFVGNLRVFEDSIYYVDQKFSRIFIFDKNGDYYGVKLGMGRGPREYPGGQIYDYFKTPKGENLLLGFSNDMYIYDTNWNLQYQKKYKWREIASREELLKNPIPSEQGMYSLTHDTSRDKLRLDGDFVYLEIECDHPTFNMINSINYYKLGRVIAKLNYKTGEISDIIGRRSLAYKKYTFVGHLSYATYDNANDSQFYLGFQTDSLLYLCSNEFIPIKAFGRAGKNMDTKYTEFSEYDIKKARQVYANDTENCGYYDRIEFIQERNLLFRSYTRGKQNIFDGLQIYHNNILIGDVDVPKGFRVEGYIAPYFISNAFTASNYESMKFYLFELDIF